MDLRYRDREWLERKYVRDGRLIREIAEECDVSLAIIGYHLKKYGLKRLKGDSSGGCLVCGKPIGGIRSKYCSRECNLEAQRRKKPRYAHVCVECGKAFENGVERGKFCSPSCEMTWVRRELRTGLFRSDREQECAVCRRVLPLEEFERTLKLGKPGIVCGECRERAKSEKLGRRRGVGASTGAGRG